jgi:hypothetical protein
MPTDTACMGLLRTAIVLALAIGSTACFDMFKNIFDSPTSPSDAEEGVRSYLGTWNGPTAAPAAQSCGGLAWKITSQTGNQASGEFGATCADGVSLAGTVTATHSATTIPWAATGTATKGGTSCPFTMTGTGTFQGTSHILLTYSGTSCNGPVSGTETITR